MHGLHYIVVKEMKKVRRFKTGAVRCRTDGEGRYDLLSPHAIHRLALVFEEGAKKYSDRNWERGIPEGDLIDHALRHIFQHMMGDTSEDHIGHAFWNLGAILHFQEVGKKK